MKNAHLNVIIAIVALALSMLASYSMCLTNDTGTQLLGSVALMCGAVASAAATGILRQDRRPSRKKA